MLSGRLLSCLKKGKITRNGHSLSFVVPLVVTRCHSLSLVATCCHSLSLVVPFVVTRCTKRCHSLSFVVISCHSLYHSLSLVVTRYHSMCHSSVFLQTIVFNDMSKNCWTIKTTIFVFQNFFTSRYFCYNVTRIGRVIYFTKCTCNHWFAISTFPHS